MVYSEVIKNGWVLPKKAKYTIKDVNTLVNDSLFGKYGNRTFSDIEAAFIVRTSAIHWDTEYSKSVAMVGKKDTDMIKKALIDDYVNELNR